MIEFAGLGSVFPSFWSSGFLLWLLCTLCILLFFLWFRCRNRFYKGELRGSLKDLYAVFNSLPIMVLVCDIERKISFMNRTLPQYTPESVVGHNIFEFVNPDDLTRMQAAIDKSFQTGEVTNYEAGGPSELGITWFAVQVQPIFRHRKVTHLAIYLTDITDRKKVEMALQESQSRYEDVVSSLPGVVYQFLRTSDGRYHMPYVSPRVWDFFQVKADEATSDVSNLFKLVHSDDKQTLDRSIEESAAQFSIWKHEFRIQLSDGKIKWIRGTSSPRHIKNGDILWSGVLLDVTAEKVAEAERKNLELQLQHSQKMEALGTLAAGISHDFNNILQIISTSIELAEKSHPFDATEKAFLKKALTASDRGRNLIRQILAFCRNEEEKKEVFDLSLLATDFFEMIKATLPSGLSLSYKIEPGINFWGSGSQIHQILINLTINALHAVRGRVGEVHVFVGRFKPTPNEAKTLQLDWPQPYIEISVKDSGIGIEPGLLSRIFDPFFTTKQQGGGTGLGLSVVHGIVRSHNGEITVTSEQNKGSLFRVFLPHEENRQHSSFLPEKIITEPTRSHRILLIEDEKDLLELEKAMLRNFNFDVIDCSSGEEALELLWREEFDLVLSDNSLPGITGLELMKKIRLYSKTLPFLIATGQSDNEIQKEAHVLGMDEIEILPKPFSLADLRKKMGRLLETSF